MLSFDIYRALADLTSAIHRATAAAIDRAPAGEIELGVNAALEAADRLEAITETKLPVLRRHLSWLRRRHREGKPELADADIADLRERDLPAVMDAVAAWSANLLDAGLIEAVDRSWQAQQYDAAVRGAFVYLEQRLREVAGVAPGDGVTGRKLVARVLPGGGASKSWSTNGFMGHLTAGEQRGARELLDGAFSLFRNATAHRPTSYTRVEAEDVVHLVSLCLRLADKLSPPPGAA